MAYHQFQPFDDEPYGSFETFRNTDYPQADPPFDPGWYWWACSPGCLPDGEAIGPFETEQEAIEDANTCS